MRGPTFPQEEHMTSTQHGSCARLLSPFTMLSLVLLLSLSGLFSSLHLYVCLFPSSSISFPLHMSRLDLSFLPFPFLRPLVSLSLPPSSAHESLFSLSLLNFGDPPGAGSHVPLYSLKPYGWCIHHHLDCRKGEEPSLPHLFRQG